jgi:hypothetical protein
MVEYDGFKRFVSILNLSFKMVCNKKNQEILPKNTQGRERQPTMDI